MSMMNPQAATIIAGQDMVGLIVKTEFVTEGILRRPGEILPAVGGVAALIAAGYVEPMRRGSQRSTHQCKLDECYRKFVDEGTLEAHQSRDHDPRMLAMRERMAADLDPEPAAGMPDTPATVTEAVEAASDILPVGVPANEE